MTADFHGRVRQSSRTKRLDGSMRSRIWGTKFQEIYKGCLNKYIALNDNRCKHISERQIRKNSKQVENFLKKCKWRFLGGKKGLSLYMYKHCLVTQIYLEKLF